MALPPPQRTVTRFPERWTIRRKQDLLKALDSGITTPAIAAALHDISAEELAAWRRDFASDGIKGLRATRVGYYRRKRRS